MSPQHLVAIRASGFDDALARDLVVAQHSVLRRGMLEFRGSNYGRDSGVQGIG